MMRPGSTGIIAGINLDDRGVNHVFTYKNVDDVVYLFNLSVNVTRMWQQSAVSVGRCDTCL